LYGGVPLPHRETKVEYSAKESMDWFLRAELILAGDAIRYSLEAENFNFNPLGEAVTTELAGNFCLLVRGLAAHAPKARMNRGVKAIVSDACEFVYYPRKNAFLDELVWLLWRAQEERRE
jgi:hypothetical protein